MNINYSTEECQLAEAAISTFQDNLRALNFEHGHWSDTDSEKTHAQLDVMLAKLQPQREITLVLYYQEPSAEFVLNAYMNGLDSNDVGFDYSAITLSENDHNTLEVLSNSMQETQSETKAILVSSTGELAQKLGCWNLGSLESLFETAYPTVTVLCWDNNAKAEDILKAWTGDSHEYEHEPKTYKFEELSDEAKVEYYSSLVMSIGEKDFAKKMRVQLSEDANMKCLVIHKKTNNIACVLKSYELCGITEESLQSKLKEAFESANAEEIEFEVEIKQMVEYSKKVKVKAKNKQQAEQRGFDVASNEESLFTPDDYEFIEANGSVYDNSANEVNA